MFRIRLQGGELRRAEGRSGRLSGEQGPVERLHQPRGARVVHPPEALDEGRGAGEEEAPAQADHLVAAGYDPATGFAGAEGHEGAVQGEAQDVAGAELAVRELKVSE